MQHKIICMVLLSWLISPCVFGDSTPAKPEHQEQPNKEDLKIIAAMDVLELMDLVEDMDLLKDLDIIIEEDQNEKTN